MSDPVTQSTPNVALVFERIAARADRPVLWDDGEDVSGAELLARTGEWSAAFDRSGIGEGAIVGFVGEFTKESISLLLCLARRRRP